MSTSAEGDRWPGSDAPVARAFELRLRLLLPLIYVVALALQVIVWGVPVARGHVLAWVMLGMVAFTPWTDGAGRVTSVIRDWLPLAGLLVAYDHTRAVADTLGMPIQERVPAQFDRWLFGGDLPTEVLQTHLLDARDPAPWEALVALVYISHFFVPYAILAVLWIRDRGRWIGVTARFLTLTAAGLLTYILVPAAPPWLLSEQGRLGDLDRTATRGLELIELDVAAQIIERGQRSVNTVAALPSMHAAYPMLFTIVLWPLVPKLARVGLAAYTVAMGFTLVLSAEHFIFDVLLGWLYAAAVCAVFAAVRRRSGARRSTPYVVESGQRGGDLTPALDAELAQYRRHVGGHGADADRQLGGDLRVGPADREQAGDLRLAGREAERP